MSGSCSRRRELSFADACDRLERKPDDPSASCSSSTPLSTTGGAVANVLADVLRSATGGSSVAFSERAFSKSGVGDPGLSCELSSSAMGEGRRPLTIALRYRFAVVLTLRSRVVTESVCLLQVLERVTPRGRI